MDECCFRINTVLAIMTLTSSPKSCCMLLKLPYNDRRAHRNVAACMDIEGAESFWPFASRNSYHFDRYDILYKNKTIRFISKKALNQTRLIVYMVITTEDITFVLTQTTKINLWEYKLYNTKHSKLLIIWKYRKDDFSRYLI